MKVSIVDIGFSQLSFRLKHAFCSFLVVISITGATAFAGDVQQPNLDDLRLLFKQAKKLYEKGDLAEAAKIYRKIIEINPAGSAAKLELAYVLLKQRQLREAYDISFAVAKAEQRNARAFSVLGSTFLSAGRFEEAKACFINALSINRKENLAWAGLGMLDFYENRISDSIENLKEAVYREPNEPDYHFALAQVSARAERYKEAAESYRRFLMVSKDTDDERRARIKGLINFLNFLGQKSALYVSSGEDSTSVKFRLVGNRPVIQLSVNGNDERLNFVLDTGSGISVISDKTARKLNIKPITRGGFAKGIGGDGKFEIVYGFLREVGIGAVRVRNIPVYIRQFHTTNEEIDGYIGLSLISKFLTTIDYGDLTFMLAKKISESASAEGKDISLPLRLTSSGFLSGEVKLEGIDNTFNFIVDTGASVSVISDDLASMQPVSQFLQVEKMRVIGSAGVTEDVRSFMLPRVTFGQNSRQSITAIALDLDIINEASGFEQAGILGGNFLRNYRLTFDFKNSKVTFIPISREK